MVVHPIVRMIVGRGDFESVFANLVHLRADGLVIGGGAFFFSRIKQLAALAIRHAVPAILGRSMSSLSFM